jgi:hypothetical protein
LEPNLYAEFHIYDRLIHGISVYTALQQELYEQWIDGDLPGLEPVSVLRALPIAIADIVRLLIRNAVALAAVHLGGEEQFFVFIWRCCPSGKGRRSFRFIYIG